jgi:hypothetical protein
MENQRIHTDGKHSDQGITEDRDGMKKQIKTKKP